MKNFIVLLVMLCAGSLMAQSTIPGGCVTQVNVPAEYVTDEGTIIIPEIVDYVTSTETVTIEKPAKDAALEDYFECDEKGALKKCTRKIEAETQTFSYLIAANKVAKVIQEGRVIKYKHLKKVADGYIAWVPCEKIEDGEE